MSSSSLSTDSYRIFWFQILALSLFAWISTTKYSNIYIYIYRPLYIMVIGPCLNAFLTIEWSKSWNVGATMNHEWIQNNLARQNSTCAIFMLIGPCLNTNDLIYYYESDITFIWLYFCYYFYYTPIITSHVSGYDESE